MSSMLPTSKLRTPVLFVVLALVASTWAAALGDLTSESSETHALAADGRVSLENINGDVKIEGWDQNEVRVEWVIRSSSQRKIDDVKVEIDATADRIHIETRYDRDDRWSFNNNPATVDYTLMVPRGADIRGIDLVNGDLRLSGLDGRVEVELVNGDVDARSLTGDLDISSVNGRVEVELGELAADRDVALETVNGSIELSVPNRADADISAETVHGRIDNDFGFEVNKDGFVGRDLRGSLGRGGARISLETVNGSIDIRSAN